MPPEREPRSRVPRSGRQRLRRLGVAGVLISLALLATPAGARGESAKPGPIPPTDPRRRVARLENPRRDEALQPDQVVAALGLAPGDVVADIGSGPGYFTLRFAREVGPTGRVYGVDIEPYFLTELERLAREAGLANVVPLLTAPASPGLPLGSCDLAFFCSSYRHIADRVEYLRDLKTRLKPGGRIAVIEWRAIPTLSGEKLLARRIGPPEDEKVDPAQVIRELLEAGLEILESPEFLELHYFLIAGARD